MMEQLRENESQLAKWVRKSKVIDRVERLPGDASSRRYYRIHCGAKTFIVMKMEPFAKEGEALPFVAIQRHLKTHGVDVPEIHDVDPSQGFLLLEDLGDTTLLRRLQEVCDADTERHHYQRILDALVRLQFFASPKPKGPKLDAFKLRFDTEKLMWEVQHTIEHFYLSYLKRSVSKQDLKTMQSGFNRICSFLAKQPVVLTHRDFHSRNIMIKPEKSKERIVMIDFQDARMGPAQYDLASLLRDSYYQLEETQINRLLDYYIARWEGISEQPIDREIFFLTFDLMSVQRNFKAIGSFASFLNKRNDAGYLKYIGNTFENIRRALLKYPEYSKLREVLFNYYYF